MAQQNLKPIKTMKTLDVRSGHCLTYRGETVEPKIRHLPFYMNAKGSTI